ncbi:rRNA maturation RNase YbeY [Halanaerobaculum tunisiense]
MTVLINNLQSETELEDQVVDIIQQVVNQVLKSEVQSEPEVSIAVVDNDYIQQLNKKFRQQDESTDVLSFPQEEEDLLGDIVISLETAREQAKEYNHSSAREVGFLTVHGMLHLLGHNHKQQQEREIMRSKEEEILARLGLSRD